MTRKEIEDFLNDIHPNVYKHISFLQSMRNRLLKNEGFSNNMKRGLENWYRNKRILNDNYNIDTIKLKPIIDKLENFYNKLHNVPRDAGQSIDREDVTKLGKFLIDMKHLHKINKTILREINNIYIKYESIIRNE